MSGRPRMQAKDINDAVFLATVGQIETAKGYWANVDEVQAALAGMPNDVEHWPQVEAAMPRKVVLAKASKLIRRGLMDGCTCGCRGDFTLELWPAAPSRCGRVLPT